MRTTRFTFIILMIIIGIGFYQMLYYLIKDVDRQALQAVEEVMVDSSHLLAGVVELQLENGGSLKDGVDSLGETLAVIEDHKVYSKIYQRDKKSIGLGVYVADCEGLIMYDSDEGKREGDNYLHFNDVRLTLAGKYGARSTRMNPQDERSSVMYVAAPILKDGRIVGSLSVFKPQEDVREFVEARGRKLVWVIMVTGVAVMSLCAIVLIWIYRPVGVLTRYAEEVSKGARLPLPSLGKGREVNTLGKALFEMRETLEGRRYVENYVHSLTHELKSPLAGIKGAAELLGEKDLPIEKRHAFLSNIQKEVDRGELLVNDLLCLSQLESMHYLKNKESIEVQDWVVASLGKVTPYAEQKQITFELVTEHPCRIAGDRKILEMALVHLLQNAVAFSPVKGNIQIAFKRRNVRGKACVSIEVIDGGVGMPSYAEERVFEHFYSLPRPNGMPKSTGLGLPLVKEAMLLHGGEVSLKNRQDAQGCVASLFLPFEEA